MHSLKLLQVPEQTGVPIYVVVANETNSEKVLLIGIQSSIDLYQM